MDGAELPASPPQPEPFQFTGTGSDYFRIWIVNIALTILTLGIYSAWAKVRRLQYFHRNTRVAGASFDYHGPPGAILKGRVVAFAIFAAYNLAGKFDPLLALAIAAPIAIALPWLLRQSLRFRLHYSSWRGLRFAFRGDLAGAYRVFLLWPVLTLASLYGLGPMWHQRLKRYQHNYAAFGTTPFRFSATVGAFYGPYLRALGLLACLILAGGLVFGLAAIGRFRSDWATVLTLSVVTVFVALLGYAVVIGPYLVARIQNLVWNHTTLGPHRFQSRLRARSLAWITVTNLLLSVITLGLYRPFAAVRLARYRTSCMVLLPGAALDAFLAGETARVQALGEEMGEFLDIDIAL